MQRHNDILCTLTQLRHSFVAVMFLRKTKSFHTFLDYHIHIYIVKIKTVIELHACFEKHCHFHYTVKLISAFELISVHVYRIVTDMVRVNILVYVIHVYYI